MRAALIAWLCLGASLAQAERRIAIDAEQRIDSAAADALDVADAFAEALAAGQLETVKSLLAEDVIVLESGGVEASRDEYFAYHAAADAKFLAGSTQTIKRRIARGDGRRVWIATESDLKPAGKDVIASTETLVLEKRKAGWKIVHIHWSSR